LPQIPPHFKVSIVVNAVTVWYSTK